MNPVSSVTGIYPIIVSVLACLFVLWLLCRPVGTSGEERLAASVAFWLGLVAAILVTAGVWLGWLIYTLCT